MMIVCHRGRKTTLGRWDAATLRRFALAPLCRQRRAAGDGGGWQRRVKAAGDGSYVPASIKRQEYQPENRYCTQRKIRHPTISVVDCWSCPIFFHVFPLMDSSDDYVRNFQPYERILQVSRYRQKEGEEKEDEKEDEKEEEQWEKGSLISFGSVEIFSRFFPLLFRRLLSRFRDWFSRLFSPINFGILLVVIFAGKKKKKRARKKGSFFFTARCFSFGFLAIGVAPATRCRNIQVIFGIPL